MQGENKMLQVPINVSAVRTVAIITVNSTEH